MLSGKNGFDPQAVINPLFLSLICLFTGGGDFKSPEQFKLSLPQRTNYLYGRITKTLPEMYAFTLCMWIKSSASPGIGTPFSYGVPGQANEIVLIEWGNNPIELLINDMASVRLKNTQPLMPLGLHDEIIALTVWNNYHHLLHL